MLLGVATTLCVPCMIFYAFRVKGVRSLKVVVVACCRRNWAGAPRSGSGRVMYCLTLLLMNFKNYSEFMCRSLEWQDLWGGESLVGACRFFREGSASSHPCLGGWWFQPWARQAWW